jgi:hypothetical protein
MNRGQKLKSFLLNGPQWICITKNLWSTSFKLFEICEQADFMQNVKIIKLTLNVMFLYVDNSINKIL